MRRRLSVAWPFVNAFAGALLFSAVAFPHVAAAVTVTLQPSTADTQLAQGSATTNYGTATTIQVASQSGSQNKRILFKFDLSSIPAGATINSATLQFYVVTAPSQNRTYNAHRMTRDWVEAQATWNIAQTGTNWTTGGGDYNGTATGSATVRSSDTGNWINWTITADVQAWVNGTANYGTLIKDGTESSSTARTTTFASRENATTANRPTLVIDYQPAYTITLPGSSAVVMAESSLLNFTISNIDQSPATEKIGRILLTFPYTVSGAVPPAGWKVTDITGSQVLFDTEDPNDPGCSSAALGNGQSAVFGVYVTGTAAAAEVTTDTVSSATVGNDCNTPGAFQYYFTQSGSFPTWARRGLGNSVVATPVNIGVGGTITLTMTVTNRTTGTQNGVTPVTNPTITGSGTVSKLSGPTPASANLASGASQNFTYTYSATGSGNVTFTATASNASVQTLSASDSVQIGTLTASLDVTPTQPTSGGQVTVTLSVTNNGGTALTSVTPSSLTTSGTATASLVSGPTPASVASLGAGATTSFSWTYTISGSAGATFQFSGNASASGGTTSNTATSSTGSISTVSVSVSPTTIPTSSAATLTYTVNNQTGQGIQTVVVTAPTTGFVYSSATPPSGWTVSTAGSPTAVTFQSGGTGSDLATGNSGNFVVAWSAVPSSANMYSFTVDMATRNSLSYSRSASVTVSQYSLTISASPTTLPGDAASTSTITVTLTSGGSPLSGATITLTKTMGTLTQETLTTNASGQATTTYTAAKTTTNQTATITATYGASITASTNITLEGIVLAVSASPATIDADGQSTSTVTITLTKNGVAYSGRTVTLSSSAGTVGSGSMTTNGSGQATTTLTSTASETDVTATLTAGYLSPTFTTTTSVTFTRMQLTVSASPTTIAADGQATSTVTVTLTRAGVAVSGATISLSTSAGTISPTSVTTNASGQATATLTASVSETNVTATVTATYKGHQKTTSVTFQRVILTVSASPTTIAADGVSTSTISLTLTLNGSALSGATISLSTNSGTLGATSVVTNASGQASTTLTSIASGSDVTATVTATYKGHVKTTSVTFGAVTLTLTASPASVPADGATTSTLTATLTTGGSPLSGKTVNFSTTGGTLSASSAVTNGSGVATVTLRSTTASKSTSTPSVTATYNTLTAVRSVTLTGITIAEATDLTVISNLGTNTAYWAWPGTGNINGVILLRRTGGTPQIPPDGTSLSVGNTLADGSVVIAKVASGGGTSFSQSGLTAGTTYYYRIFGYFTSGNLYSAAGLSVDAPGTGVGAGQARWVASNDTAGTTEPTLDGNGGVLWASTAGGLADVNLSNGTQLWSPALSSRVVGNPLLLTDIAGQSGWYAIVGTDAGTVAAVDVSTGTVLWETASLGTAIGSAAVMQYGAYSNGAYQALYGTGDLVIVGTRNASTSNNKVYALDASNGATKWTFNAAGGTSVDQVTGWGWVDHATNHVLMTTKSNAGTQPSLWALSTLNGSVVGSWSLGDITAWLSLGMNGEVYIGTTGGKLYALTLATLTWKWTGPFDLGASNGLVSWVWEDWDDRGHLYLSTTSGHVWKLTTSGTTAPPTQTWKTAVAGASAPLVLVSQGKLWVGGSDGKIHQLRLSDGVDEKQATVGAGTAAVSAPSWDSSSGWLYVGTVAGKVFAIPTPLP